MSTPTTPTPTTPAPAPTTPSPTATWLRSIQTILQGLPGIIAHITQANPGVPDTALVPLILTEIGNGLTQLEANYATLLATNPTIQAIFTTVINATLHLHRQAASLVATHQAETKAAAAKVTVPPAPGTLSGAGASQAELAGATQAARAARNFGKPTPVSTPPAVPQSATTLPPAPEPATTEPPTEPPPPATLD
jgi:hypothetical protein